MKAIRRKFRKTSIVMNVGYLKILWRCTRGLTEFVNYAGLKRRTQRILGEAEGLKQTITKGISER